MKKIYILIYNIIYIFFMNEMKEYCEYFNPRKMIVENYCASD